MVIVLLIARGIYLGYVVYSHQVNWARHTDRGLLDTKEIRFAPQGMLLLVESDSEIVKVQRQVEAPFFGSVSRPFSPFMEPRWKANKISDGESVVLVEYRFKAGKEWYLELFSSDNHWLSMSPYFPAKPHLSSAQWEDLWNKEHLKKDTTANLFIEQSCDDLYERLETLERKGGSSWTKLSKKVS